MLKVKCKILNGKCQILNINVNLHIPEQGSRSARLSPQSMIHYARKLFIIVFHQNSTVFHNIEDDQMTR